MENCIVEYGGDYGNIRVNNASPTIQYNTIHYSLTNGVYAYGSGSNNAVIACNNIVDNNQGIYLISAYPTITGNNFSGNTTYALYNASSSTVTAEDNWWDDENGPGYNGEDVYGNIDYDPWLTEESGCIDGDPTNLPPLAPTNPSPANGAVNVELTDGALTATWTGQDLNVWDTLTYDVYIGTAEDSLTLWAEDLSSAETEFTSLSEGTTYYWKVIVEDLAGDTATSPVWHFTTQGPPPDLVVTDISWSPATDIEAGQTVTFTATIENTGEGPCVEAFQTAFYIDGTQIGTGSVAPILYIGDSAQLTATWTAATGDHTIEVVVDNGSAVEESDETNNSLTAGVPTVIDPTPPTLVSASPADGSILQSASIIVVVLEDEFGTVDDAAVISSFTVTDGSGQTVSGTVTESDDAFTFTPDGGSLASGDYTVSLTATDAAGNTLAVSFSFTVDAIAPAAPTITGDEVTSGTLTVRPAANASNTVSVTVTGTREADTRVIINGTTQAALGSDDWSVALTLSEGDNALEVLLEDAAGNQSESVYVDILADTTAPVMTGITPEDESFLNTPLTTVAIDYTETGAGVDLASSVYCLKDSVLATVAGDWTLSDTQLIFTPSATLPESVYQVEVQLTDSLGHESDALRTVFTVDQTAPDAPAIDPVESPTHTITQTITGTKEAYAAIRLEGEAVVENTDTETWQYTATLEAGTNTFSFTAVDRAGNESDPATVVIEFDDTPPLAVDTLTADPNGDGMSVQLSWEGYDESLHGDIASYRVYSETATFTSVSGLTNLSEVAAGTFTATVSELTRDTAYWFAVVAVDEAGNYLEDVTPVSTTPVDILPPEDATGLAVVCYEDSLTLTWTGSANTGEDLASYSLYVDGELEAESLATDATSHDIAGLTAATAYGLKLTATDADGNESDGATYIGVTLLDNPADLAAEPYSGYATLTWTAATPEEYVGQYRVYVSESSFTDISGMTADRTATASTAAITGLTNGVSYYAAVTTVNISGGERTAVTPITVTPIEDVEGPTITSLTYDDETLADGQTLTESGIVAAVASDPAGVSRLAFYFDGELVRQDYSTPYSCYLDIVNSTDGAHLLTITAYDTLRNESSYDYALTVDLDVPAAPVITAPENGEVTNKLTYSVAGTSDKYTEVILIHDGEETTVTGTVGPLGTFSISYTLSEGENTLQAVAENRTGRGETSGEILVTVDTSIPDSPRSLTAEAREGGKVKLLWQKPLDTALAGYNVYRSSESFSSIDEADQVNTDLVIATGYADLPDSEGTWYYRVTALDAAGNESALSGEVSAVSDQTMPRAVSIEYLPQGVYDPDTGRIAPGRVDVNLTVSEPLGAVPFLTLTPEGGIPISVELTKSDDLLYTGHFEVKESTPSGTAWAVFSARDLAGNRGTEVDAGESILLDTDGPAVGRLEITPAEPVKNSDSEPVDLFVSFGITEAMPSGELPDIYLLVAEDDDRTADFTGLAEVDTVSGDVQSFEGSVTLPADAGYDAAETFRFVYQGVDDLGNLSDEVAAINDFQVYQGGLPPLSAPTNLKAQAGPGGSVDLSWDEVEEAAGYEIYRQAPDEDELTYLDRVEGEVAYDDQTLQDGLHTYAVASIRRENDEESVSGMSSPAQATADAVAPLAPANLVLDLVSQGIRCQWEAPAYTETITYAIYRSSDTEITSVEGMTPLVTGIEQTMVIDPTPSPTDHCYVITAMDAAGNESEPSNSYYLNFDLLPVATLQVVQTDFDPPVVSWTHSDTSGDIAGYWAYIGEDVSGLQVNQVLMTETSFVDYGWADDERSYTVVAVDTSDIESLARTITLPMITADLTAESRIDRGIMNKIEYVVENHSEHAYSNVRMKADIGGYTHISDKFSLAAGETVTVPVIVGGYETLEDYEGLTSTIQIIPNSGETVKIVTTEEIAVGDNLMVLTILNEEFLRGGVGTVSFTFENTGGAPVEIITAESSNNSASTEITFYLLDEDENVLYSKAFKQSLGDDLVTLANKKTVARIPAGEIFTSEAFELFVPANAPDLVTVRMEIENVYYNLGQSSQVTMRGTATRHQVALMDTSYYGEITDITPAESKGEEDILITGRAIDRSTEQSQPEVPLNLVITLRGFERKSTVSTDETGSFSHTFEPNPGEAGVYSVRAVHPDLLDKPVQGQFVINRVGISPAIVNLSIPRNYEQKVSIKVQTETGTDLTNLRLEQVGDLPTGVYIDLGDAIETVASGQKITKNLTIWADNTAGETGTVELAVKSDESGDEAWGSVVVNCAFTEAKPVLYFTPDHIETGVAREDIVTETITLKNQGLADMTGVSLALLDDAGNEAPSWVQINSSADVGTLAVGESRDVSISFLPGSTVDEGLHTFYLRVGSDNYPETDIGLYVSVSQSGIGNVLFKISDIYTGTFNEDNELVRGLKGAKVRVQNESVLTIDQTATTDEYGEILFEDLPTGSYKCKITASNHQEYTGRFWIKPGITVNKEVFLEYNLVTVEWEVNEITIEDKYEIVLTATFETDVPAAVVVTVPSSVELPDMETGDVYNGEFVLTNYGLIRADEIELEVPQNDENFKFELLAGLPDSIEAKEKITVPYRVTCLKSLDQEEETGTGGGCGSYLKCIQASYSYECANGGTSGGATSHCYYCSYGSCGGSGDGGVGSSLGSIVSDGGTNTIGYVGGSGTQSGSAPSSTAMETPEDECAPDPPEQKGECSMAFAGQTLCNTPESSGNQCQTVGSSVGLLSGLFGEIEEDLAVKVMGGQIKIERIYYEHDWVDRFLIPFYPDKKDAVSVGTVTTKSSSSSSSGQKTGITWSAVPSDPNAVNTGTATNMGTSYIKYQGINYEEISDTTDSSPLAVTAYRVYAFGTNKIKMTTQLNDDDTYTRTYVWESKDGGWMEYELTAPLSQLYKTSFTRRAYLTSFGNNTGVVGSVVYDEVNPTRMAGIADRNGTQVVWYEYNDDGTVASVHDIHGRSVEYQYDEVTVTYFSTSTTTSTDSNDSLASGSDSDSTGGVSYSSASFSSETTYHLLERVTGPTGTEKIYGYNYDSDDGELRNVSIRLVKVIDENGNERNISRGESGYSKVSSVLDQDGNGYYFEYDYDKNQQEYYTQVKSTTGKVREVWFDTEGNTKRVDINGDTVQEIEVDGRNLTITDENGFVTKKEYDEWENLTKVEYPDGSVVTREYDHILDKIIRKTDENGIVTEYEYDDSGNLTRKIEAVGTEYERSTENVYDSDGNLVSITRLGDDVVEVSVVAMDYDVNGNMVAMTDPEGDVTSFTYDAMGNVLSKEDPLGNIWQYTYDNIGQMLTATDPMGNVVEYVYDGAGNKIAEIDPNGNSRTYEYDTRYNLSKVTDFDGGETLFEYTFDGMLLKQTDPEGKEINYEYDSDLRLASTIDGNGNIIDIEYDGSGSDGCSSCSGGGRDQASLISFPSFDRAYSYDSRGRRTIESDILDDQNSTATQYGYDKAGNLTYQIDREGRATFYEYDALNRLVKVTDPADGETRYTYDSRDNLIALEDANGNLTSFEYDLNNRLVKETRPLGQATTYQYDAAGNLIEKIDAEGIITNYDYDDAGRLVSINYYNPVDPVNPVKTVVFTYDNAGNLLTYDDGTTSAAYAYDDAYRKISETVDYSDFTLSSSYEYYLNGAKLSYTGPDGIRYEYDYDDNNQLAGVEIPDVGMISYNEYDWIRPIEISLPGGTVKTLSYDPLMRIESIISQDPGSNTMMTYQYDYDSMDNIIGKATEHGEYAYDYDELYRLTSTDSPETGIEAFSYDLVGNRLTSEDVSGDWSYSVNNELLDYGDVTYAYDENGSIIQKIDGSGTTNYIYDLEGRLTEVEDGDGSLTASYYYDPFGRRLWKEMDGVRTYFHYSDEGLVGEYDDSGTKTKAYGYKPDSTWSTDPLFMKTGGEYYYYHNDHLGTPQKLTKENGEIVWSAFYSSFGEAQVVPASTVENNFRFAGQYYDQETGLHYNYFRYYDPSLGRYLRPDPIGLAGGMNLYEYSVGNPINYYDPYGLFKFNAEYKSGLAITAKLKISALKLNVDIDAGSQHSPLFGPDYVSQGLSVSGEVGPLDVGLGVERTAIGEAHGPSFDRFGNLIMGSGLSVLDILEGTPPELVPIVAWNNVEWAKITIGAQFLIGGEVTLDFRDEVSWLFNKASKLWADDECGDK